MSRTGGVVLLLAAAQAAAAAGRSGADQPAAREAPAPSGPVDGARQLLWHGELAAAERAFLAILQARPGEVDAWIGLAQSRRWAGHPLAALEPAARAVALAPLRRDAREELAWAWVDAGRPRRAEALLQEGGVRPSPELAGALEKRLRPRMSLSGTGSDDSTGVVRLAPRLALTLSLPGDVRLVLGGGATRVRDGGPAVDRSVEGAALEVPWERVSFFSAAAGWQGAGGPQLDGQLGASWQPIDALRLALGVRRRNFLEPVEPLAVDEDAFYGAGAGGAMDPWQLVRTRVDEARLRLGASPFAGSYVYADARGFRVGDWNSGYSAALGIGVDLVALLARGWPIALVARWDTYLTGLAERRAAYYSPSSLVAQSPGAEVRVRIGSAVELLGEGGHTFASGAPGGWYGGAGGRLRLGGFSLSLRAQARDDPWYRTRKAWLSLEAPL